MSDVFFKFRSNTVYLMVTKSFTAYLFRAGWNQRYRDNRWGLIRSGRNADATSSLLVDYLFHRKIEQTIEQLPFSMQGVFPMSRFKNEGYHEIAEEVNLCVKIAETPSNSTPWVMDVPISSKDTLPPIRAHDRQAPPRKKGKETGARRRRP